MDTMSKGCRCLYEIENELPRTQFCFMPCRAQDEILRERMKQEQIQKEKEMNT